MTHTLNFLTDRVLIRGIKMLNLNPVLCRFSESGNLFLRTHAVILCVCVCVFDSVY